MRVKKRNFSGMVLTLRNSPNAFRTNHTCLPTTCFSRILLKMELY